MHRVAADVAGLRTFDAGFGGLLAVSGAHRRHHAEEQGEEERTDAAPLHCARASSAAHWLSQVSVKLTVVGMAKVLTP
jgi:hypothetical protein